MGFSRRVAIIIVTYNRIKLLETCIKRLENYALDAENIVIVNNASTDGTTEYLSNILDSRFIILNQSSNQGGSAGFYIGIKYVMENLDVDYLWIMDDDTFVHEHAMDNLLSKFELDPYVGFVSSHVIYKDDKAHVMNIPRIQKKYSTFDRDVYVTDFMKNHCLVISTGSFVSLMIKTDVIRKIGYPIKDYFIWVDDSEYTGRITNQGYVGLLSSDSIVTHYTSINNGTNIIKDSDANSWRYFYLIRNKFHFYRTVYRPRLLFFLFIELPAYFLFIFKRKSGKILYFKNFLKGFFHGMFFNPKIEYLEK